MYAFPYSVFPVFHTVFADFTLTHRHGVLCIIYTYFVYTVRIYVISGPDSRYFPTLLICGLRVLRFQGNNSERSVCRFKLQPRQRSAKAASACFGASGMNNTLFRSSRQTGACDSAEHQVAEVKDSLYDQQTRLLDEADAKV